MRALLGSRIELELGLTASDAAIRMDPDHVEQIVLSALRNAKQAMPNGGTFRVETASVELGGTTRLRGVISARCVRWTMADTGLGMNESTRRRAFEPFFTTKAAGEGTGLGLSMISAVVDRAGGVVTLESQLGHGTSLIVHVPRATGFMTSTPAPESGSEEPEATRAVLLVEDDPEARVDLATRLRSAGCDVVQAANGIEALELLRKLEDRVNLVLIDENLPGASMEELLRAVRSLSEEVEVLITPLTSMNGQEVDAKAITGTVLRALNAIRYADS
jgi:CheY-like chemotaxis protein